MPRAPSPAESRRIPVGMLEQCPDVQLGGAGEHPMFMKAKRESLSDSNADKSVEIELGVLLLYLAQEVWD
jgi:hypothetical protein